MIRAAVYCRLSDEDRNKKSRMDESESIQNQKSLLLTYCREQNWEVAGVYCDEDMSGADRKRPQFNQMILDCEKGYIDIVLCKTQSRFSRDIEVVEHYIHNRFREWGVRFIGLLDHADTEDFANKKSRQINGLVNEWYLEDLSENIKKTLRHKKENGIFTGAFAPYGYKLNKDVKGKLFVDEPAAETVREIYRMYAGGHGYVKIAQELNRQGIPCPSEYKRLCGSKFQTHGGKPTSKIWTESVIREILTNEVYVGNLVQGKTATISYKNKKRKRVNEQDFIRTKNAHEPVVDMNLWNEVNKKIGSHRRMQKADGKRHVFAGRIFCAVCGSSMWKMSYQLKNGRYEYLKCKATKCGVSVCTNTNSIRFDAVFEAVEMEVKKLFLNNYNPAKINKNSLIYNDKKTEMKEETLIKENILKQNLNIKQLYKDKLDGIIDNKVFCDIYGDIKADIVALEKRLSVLEQKKDKTEDFNFQEYIDSFSRTITLDEFAVSKLIDKVFIGEPENDSRKITICWNL